MLDKRALRAIIPSGMPDGEFAPVGDSQARNFLLAYEEQIGDSRILVVETFSIGIEKDIPKMPSNMVFFDGQEYITRALGEKSKWLTGRLGSIFEHHRYYGADVAFVNKSSCTVVAKFLGCTEEDALRMLFKHQDTIVYARRYARYQKIIDRVKEQLADIPDLPSNFERYVDREIIKERFLYYYYQKGKRTQDAYCTACEQDVALKKTRHGKTIQCPVCGAEAQMKAVIRTGRGLPQVGSVGIIQTTPKGAVARLFNYKQYYRDYRNPMLCLNEYGRLLLTKEGGLEKYSFGQYPPQDGPYRWRPSQDDFTFYNVPMYPYKEAEVFKGSRWQYSNLKAYAKKLSKDTRDYIGQSTSFHDFAKAFAKLPQIEYLHKMGLTKLISDVVLRKTDAINPEGRNPQTLLRLNQQHIKILISVNGGIRALETLQQAQKNGRTLSDDEGTFFLMATDSQYSRTKAVAALKYATPHKVVRYIKERVKAEENMTVADWIDYVGACEKLKYDLHNDFVLFPKNLQEAHDETLARVKSVNLQKDEEAYAKLYEQLKNAYQYAPAGQEYCIIVPESLHQIVKEGQALRHCVGNYAKRVATQKTLILFVRRQDAPETSFFTLEAQDGKVYQCRGYRNELMSGAVKQFANEYERTVLARDSVAKKRRKAG